MKKIYKSISIIFTGSLFLVFPSCNEPLEEEVFNQYFIGNNPSASLMNALLIGAYGELQYNGGDGFRIYLEETSSDLLWNERGGLSNNTRYFIEFTWDAQNPGWIRNICWIKPYQAIRNANFFLEAIEESQLNEDQKKQFRAEGRFIRATAYAMMYEWFGPVPLRTKTDDPNDLGRATDDEMKNFIETEFVELAPDLPLEADAVGRATRGAAYGMLTKFFLNTKQWNKAVQYADEVINLGLYELWPDYPSLFAVSSEGEEKENIFVWPAVPIPDGEGNSWPSHSYPASDYVSFPDGRAPKLPNQRISGTKNRVYESFYESFHPDDIRRTLILTEYINTDGDIITQPENKKSPFKYTPDPNADGPSNGNDYPMIRYADILMSKAEALNEISGPTQEALDLINQIRARAGVPDLTLTDASSKEVLRDLILDERGWEFWAEGKRRQDLIRHGKFIERARNRPFKPAPNAEEFRTLFPIPQAEIDANPNMVQNPGY